MNPTKEDYEDGEAWLDKTAITPDEYSREAVAYAHGRASMRADLEQARALLRKAADRGALACVASTPCEDCWRCHIRVFLESEGGDE